MFEFTREKSEKYGQSMLKIEEVKMNGTPYFIKNREKLIKLKPLTVDFSGIDTKVNDGLNNSKTYEKVSMLDALKEIVTGIPPKQNENENSYLHKTGKKLVLYQSNGESKRNCLSKIYIS